MAKHRTSMTSFDSIGQRLPHNAEAERNLLGAILVNNIHLRVAESIVAAGDFFAVSHRHIFRVMQKLSSEGQIIDLVTLEEALHDDEAIQGAGGAAFIANLADGMYGLAPVAQWARIVRDASVLRTAAHIGQAITNEALEPHAKAEEIVRSMQNRVASLDPLLGDHIPGILACDVQIERVEWVWNARVPLGKVTVLDGDPGLGKSALSLDLAARVSIGSAMPDGTPGIKGGVLILNAEDGEADTIVPRLAAMRADLTRIRILKTIPDYSGERQPEIPQDLGTIERAAISVDARLVVIDPLMAFLAGTTNTHRDQDVRRALAPLARMAERIGAAMLIVRHLNKAADGNPLYRGGGSIGIVGAARSGLLVACDPDDETGEARVLAVTKTNLGPLPISLRYSIQPKGDSIRVIWCGESTHNAAALLAVPSESERDCLLMESHGFLAVSVSSATTCLDREGNLKINPEYLEILATAERIILALDQDPAGQRCAEAFEQNQAFNPALISRMVWPYNGKRSKDPKDLGDSPSFCPPRSLSKRLRAWRCFRENLLGGGRKIVHVAEKCHRLPNLLHS